MTSLDDRLYQLFSDLLRNSKQRAGLTFNDQTLATGDGPFRTSSTGEKTLYLGPRASLLGYGHPLTYKSRLHSSLHPEIFCGEEDQINFVQDLTNFLQELIASDVHVSLGPQKSIPIYDAGRHSGFITRETYEEISEGKVVLIPNLFPFPFYLANTSPDPSSNNFYLTTDMLLSAKALLKLLRLGDFYGETGHIQRMSQEFKNELNDVECVKSIDGLLIHLDQARNYSFLDEGQYTIHLPLFFGPAFIKELKKIITE